MTQLHYLFTDGCGGVAHCHTCHAHICLLIFCIVTQHFVPEAGPMTPKFELGQDFCTMHLTAKFHHHTLNRLEVFCVDKQTDVTENIHLALLCYAGG